MLSIRRILGASSCSLALFAFAATSASAFEHASPPGQDRGHVYVNDNTVGTNTLAGFERQADGSLTAIPGSPFAIGGAGTGKGLGSQGALQASSDGRYLLAVDAGSSQISVLRVDRQGVPQPVGPPVSSGGVDPVSIAVSGNLVYVANAGAGGTNVAVFFLAPWGGLYPLPGATAALPEGSGPGDVLVSPDGRNVVVTLVNTSQIASFSVRWNGALIAAPGSPFEAQGKGPFGSGFRPDRERRNGPAQLFVTNAHNGEGLGTVSAFDVSWSGELSSIGASPFPDAQTAPCWLTISADGRFLYAVNTASGTVSSYGIEHEGSLKLLGSTPPVAAGQGAVDDGLSPDGRTLFVNASAADDVLSFAVDGGSLTAGPTTPLPTGAVASGIVVN
jgi:6-phosphogluconolactonase (cycloisomerase 2 family)